MMAGPPGAVIFVFAGCAALAPVDGGHAVAERLLFTLAGVAAAAAVCRASDWLRTAPAALPQAPLVQAPGLQFARIALCTAGAAADMDRSFSQGVVTKNLGGGGRR